MKKRPTARRLDRLQQKSGAPDSSREAALEEKARPPGDSARDGSGGAEGQLRQRASRGSSRGVLCSPPRLGVRFNPQPSLHVLTLRSTFFLYLILELTSGKIPCMHITTRFDKRQTDPASGNRLGNSRLRQRQLGELDGNNSILMTLIRTDETSFALGFLRRCNGK